MNLKVMSPFLSHKKNIIVLKSQNLFKILLFLMNSSNKCSLVEDKRLLKKKQKKKNNLESHEINYKNNTKECFLKKTLMKTGKATQDTQHTII